MAGFVPAMTDYVESTLAEVTSHPSFRHATDLVQTAESLVVAGMV
jgi:hypothetical protein